MFRYWTKVFSVLLLLSLGCFSFPTRLFAQALEGLDPGTFGSEIDYWLSKPGVSGYLAWHFLEEPGPGDIYAFGKNSLACTVLQQKALQYPDKFLGVNMYYFGTKDSG